MFGDLTLDMTTLEIYNEIQTSVDCKTRKGVKEKYASPWFENRPAGIFLAAWKTRVRTFLPLFKLAVLRHGRVTSTTATTRATFLSDVTPTSSLVQETIGGLTR